METTFKFSASTLAVTLVAVLILVILKWFLPAPDGMGMLMPAVGGNDGVWRTPFYLRYNTPVPGYLASLMPVSSNYAYNLGVPSAPYTQTTVTYAAPSPGA